MRTIRALPIGTILRGTLVDRAALHGVINRLQGLGVELLEVRKLVEGSTIRRPSV